MVGIVPPLCSFPVPPEALSVPKTNLPHNPAFSHMQLTPHTERFTWKTALKCQKFSPADWPKGRLDKNMSLG